MRWFWCLFALVACNQAFGLHDTVVVNGEAGVQDASVDSPRPDGEPAGCPASYDKILQQTASRYRVNVSTETFAFAAADCANDAPGLTHLIVLSNRQEWLGLMTTPPMFLFGDTWIGASDNRSRDARFRWVTDEDTAGFVVPATVAVEPWEPDQPDARGQCGELRASGSLHDELCTSSANYICECDGYADNPANY